MEREKRKAQMEGERNEDERMPGGPCQQTFTPIRSPMWMDHWDDDTISLLEGEAQLMLNPNLSLDWPGPWNSGKGNPFTNEDGTPLADPLLEGDKSSVCRHWLFVRYTNKCYTCFKVTYFNKERSQKLNPHTSSPYKW